MIRILPLAMLLSIAVPTVTQEGERRFDAGHFAAVELASTDRVRIVRGTEVAVTARGDPRALASLSIVVRGDTLHVERTPGSRRDRGAVVTVAVPSLRAVSLTGSGSMQAIGITAPSFTGRLDGSGNLTLAGLNANSVRLDLDGSGTIQADGRADVLAVDVGGSGRVDGRRLAASAVTVDLGGSGSVLATAAHTARISARGSGIVHVGGGARCRIGRTGSATVRCG